MSDIMEQIDRRLLAASGLPREAMNAALEITGLRPSADDWRDFAVRAMRFGGVLSLAAGVIFLVAFNWKNLALYGRFAMVEVPLFAALVVAWIKGLENLSGKLALMLAFLLTGALLALFGQTYQTGADVYELFLGWAILTLPWICACRYAPCWALWLLVVNVAIGLYTGVGRQRAWLLDLLLNRWQWSPWSVLFLFNLLLYGTLISLARWPQLGLSAAWLRRGIMTIAMGYGTCTMVYRITGGWSSAGTAGSSAALEFLLYLAASGAFAVHAFAKREDLFNFAVLALSWIVVTTVLISRGLFEDNAGIGALFIIAIYVIAASTGAVKVITYLGRQWKTEEAAG
jgi:uncharacterized membrane protein